MKILFFLTLFCLAGLNSFAQNCSQEEVEYLAQNADLVQELSQSCAFDCILASDQEQCVIECMAAELEVSKGCLQCNAYQVACVLDNCAAACIFPNSQACLNCIEQNCLPDYFVCIGDDDMDGFTEAGGDCNNQDPGINPAAVEVPNDGVDQDCDGNDLITTIDELQVDIQGWIPGMPLPEDLIGIEIYDLRGKLLYKGSPENTPEDLNGILLIRSVFRTGVESTQKWMGN